MVERGNRLANAVLWVRVKFTQNSLEQKWVKDTALDLPKGARQTDPPESRRTYGLELKWVNNQRGAVAWKENLPKSALS